MPLFVRRLRWLICFFALLLLAVGPFMAAESADWSRRVWQLEDGLPDNNVTGVAQTPDGYLWVATHGGLLRFDGLQFQEIELPVRIERRSTMIRVMTTDASNHLWLALEAGTVVECSPTATNVFTAADGVPTFRPLTINQTRDGSVWVGYANGMAVRIRDGRVKGYSGREGLPGKGECFLASDVQGQLWFAKAGRVGVFRDDQFITLQRLPTSTVHIAGAREGGVWISYGAELVKYHEGGELVAVGHLPVAASGVEASVLFEDHDGNLWVGTTAGGLFCRQPNGVVNKVGLSHDDVRCLSEDQEGNLWVGTGGGGLNRLHLRVLALESVPPGSVFQPIQSVCQDQSGRLWATTQAGQLCRRETDGWQVLMKTNGWSGASVNAVVSDGQGGVWIGTRHGGLFHWRDGQFVSLGKRDGLIGDTVRSLLVDRAGTLWVGWDSPTCLQSWREGRATTYQQPPGSRSIRAMAEDAQGRLWLGTWDGALLQLQGDRLVDETRKTKLPAKAIRCLYAAEDGGLWIGYAGRGVGRLQGNQFQLVGAAQGLHDDNICGLMGDGKGSLWFSSDHGIFRAHERELVAVAEGRSSRVQCVVYDRDEGLPILQGCYDFWPNALRAADGTLFFATRKGLAEIFPNHIQRHWAAPVAVITQIAVDGQTLNPANLAGIRLQPDHRRIEIYFTAPSFVAPENVGFRYQLSGLDEDWVNSETRRVAIYSRLPPGRYTFRVAACNNLGTWNEHAAVATLIVSPFFWQTSWFAAAMTAGLVLLVGAAVAVPLRLRHRRRLAVLRQQHALDQERARVAHDLHDDLGSGLAQIGLISSLAQRPSLAPERIREFLGQISDKSRELVTALDEIVWAVSPKHDTAVSLSNYLCDYAQEFLRPALIACRLDVAYHQPAHSLNSHQRHQLFLAFKESLTNIVRHSRATEVLIQIGSDENELWVRIEDNGKGLPENPSTCGADGLHNMSERLRQIGGHCEIQNRIGGGTSVCLRLPSRAAP